jgi:RNA polymerase sigma-70 factor (ECF subfamily)
MVLRSASYQKRLRRQLHDSLYPISKLPDENLLAREQRREVEQAFRMISDKLRSVLVLRFAADLSYSEISYTLNLPIGTVKSRLFTAIVKLRRILRGSEK